MQSTMLFDHNLIRRQRHLQDTDESELRIAFSNKLKSFRMGLERYTHIEKNRRRRHVEVGSDGDCQKRYKDSDKYKLVESQVSKTRWNKKSGFYFEGFWRWRIEIKLTDIFDTFHRLGPKSSVFQRMDLSPPPSAKGRRMI
jgi:hypothetical protein